MHMLFEHNEYEQNKQFYFIPLIRYIPNGEIAS
jgi:hypothetical protein